MDESAQQMLEQERMQASLEVLQRVDERKHTSGDVLFLAAQLGVIKQFTQEPK